MTQKIDCGGDPAFPFPCVNSYSYVFRSPIKSEPAKSILNPRSSLSLSLPVTLSCGPERDMGPQRVASSKPWFFQSSLMVVSELHLTITIRTTRARPVATLVPVVEMPLGLLTSSLGPGEGPQAFLAASIS